MTGTRLIVSADDLGLTASVDRGIAAAVAAGSVTAVSVLANLAAPAAVARLAAAYPGLSLGLHLNLTTGRPVVPADEVPTLVDTAGRFRSLAEVTRRALAGRLDRRQVRRELGAQLARLAAAGVAVDHLDSHEHVHLLPGVLAEAADLAVASGVRRMRSHRPRLLFRGGAWLGYYRRHPRRVLTHAAKVALAARLARRGAVLPDGMVSPAFLAARPGGGPLAEWTAVLAALPAGTWELVVHPADLSVPAGAHDGERLGALVARRDEELAALIAPAFGAAVAAHGVALVSFAALPLAAGRSAAGRPALVRSHG